MTAELVEIQPTTRSELDVVSRVAAAAVRLLSGHPWYVRPVDQGFEIGPTTLVEHGRPTSGLGRCGSPSVPRC